ncbi:MAG: Dabb family protein [Candidatus Hydrogenedentes bacterium]|nr:Dabb family protein [Candidatus Hydrogenedentota bacterium]
MLVTVGCVSVKTGDICPDAAACPKAASGEAKAACAGCAAPCLRHVVLFKWKDGTPPATVNEIEQAFLALPGQIPQICALEWGTDMSVENLSQGFTHCFLVSFKSEDDRAVYLPHPAHKAFGELIGPHLDKVLVFDFWAQR